MPLVLAAGPWWAFVVRGAVAILFGILTLVFPGVGLLTLVMLFGAYALVEGAFNIVAAVQKTQARRQPWWMLLFAGIVSILAALVAFFRPGLTALSLLYLIAGWAVVRGVLEIAAAISLRKVIEREWLLILSGVLSVAFGLLIALFPGTGALALVLWIAGYAIVLGAMLVGLGLKLRRLTHGHPPETGFRDLAHGVTR